MGEIELETHQLLGPVMHIQVNIANLILAGAIVDWKIQRELFLFVHCFVADKV